MGIWELHKRGELPQPVLLLGRKSAPRALRRRTERIKARVAYTRFAEMIWFSMHSLRLLRPRVEK